MASQDEEWHGRLHHRVQAQTFVDEEGGKWTICGIFYVQKKLYVDGGVAMDAKQWNLLPLWDALLEMYSAIRRVCEKYNLRFWAIGGTSLGAIRHEGFIPWDDDFDLGMPRPDYLKFIGIAEKELPKNLGWVSVETDETYCYQFGKVIERDAEKVNRVIKDSNLNLAQGVFVDVFPIDGMPSTKGRLLMFKLARAMIRRMPLSPLAYQKFLSCFSYEKSKYVGVTSLDSYKQHRCWWPRKWFNETKWLKFADTEVPVPGEYIKFIENHYRNWRELPPKEFRCPMHQTNVYNQYF